MALPTSILKFKSPGVKQILEIADNVQQASVPQGARILVINSRKGPVNRLVAISDFTQYKSYFDGISDADERRGNWSARSAEYMLSVSPIYVLNLRSFDDTLDTAGFQEISGSVSNHNGLLKNKPFKKLFNTQQFWNVDSSQLLEAQNLDKLLVFGNIGVNSVSVFVRKSKTAQYNQTLDSWYKNLGRDMPSYINPSDKVKDWMVDILVFNNTFNTSSASNVNYGYCFDVNGNVKKNIVNSSNNVVDGLDQLSSITESGYVATFTGSLINGFKNESNGVFDIVSILNSYVNSTGLLVARNESLFDAATIWLPGETPNSDGLKKPVPVDFKGHSLCHINEVGNFNETKAKTVEEFNFLSYSYSKKFLDASETEATEIITDKDRPSLEKGFTFCKMKAFLKGKKVENNVLSTGELNKFYLVGSALKPNIGNSFVGYDGNLTTVTKVTALGEKSVIYNANTEKLAIQPFGDDVNFEDSHDWEDADGTDNSFKYVGAGTMFPKNPTNDYFVYPQNHVLAGLPLAYSKTINGKGNGVVHNPSPRAVEGDYVLAKNVPMTFEEYKSALGAISSYTPSATKQIIKLEDISFEKLKAANKFNELKEKSKSVEYVYEIETDKNLAINRLNDESDLVEFSPLPFNQSKNVIVDDAGKEYIVYDNELAIFRVNDADSATNVFKPVTLKAYRPRERQFLDGTSTRQNEVLDVLKETSIANGLQNQDLYEWMYIVDGFKSFIEPSVKYQLKDVAKQRITGRSIYNLPFITDFAKSTNPYFSQEIGGDFEAKYIATGGNLELPHSNTFSLPNVDGYFAYGFGPGLLLSDGKIMPPAAVVSNLFARKHLNGTPYIIVAGNPNGIINGKDVSGVEYTFVEKNDGTGDRDYLDPFGFNLIVNKKNAGGLQLYSNKTSYNTVDSPVGSIHTSEIIMYLQMRIKSLLERYVFQYNTAQNRLIIKTQADGICQEPLLAGAIDSFVNQMDDINNNREVIANRIGILDTTIIANNGMEILVHRTKVDTLTNTASFEIL